MKRLALLAAAAALMFGCTPEVPDINVSQIVNNIFGGGTGTSPSLPGTGTVADIALGCFGMTPPGGGLLPDCAADFAPYSAPVGTKGFLNATPKDKDGNPIDGLSVDHWNVAGNGCDVEDASGPDGFVPSIEITDVSGCAVSVTIAGFNSKTRLFAGQ